MSLDNALGYKVMTSNFINHKKDDSKLNETLGKIVIRIVFNFKWENNVLCVDRN